ncbi:stage II sporulation protein M [Streptococcus suis]|uniref:Integral membrane protein DUF95 n=1 Tax=Streptococcus suis TaxID=1307 RepID=A0A123T047_STRSU|nr:stage II sporulation protein M [Streptococcus suis]NQF81521.1 stage II sporulation protein M [Streptococcus suis]NQK81066.1 stage II sporulation protein M [Streptococcus suis]NQM04171.1 stage II sporulation protein M [Streptococcus suis]NQM26804.1 stage II sporulation protein M [Streptococcus suis]NQM51423.1 stage II sporulation protein M [Streptococcus suis]
MRKFVFNLNSTAEYFKKKLLLNTLVFIVSIVVGMIFFHKEEIVINPTSQDFSSLLVNNTIVCLLIIVMGVLSFGFLGNFVLIANSVVLGRIIIGVFNLYGIVPLLHYIAPHFIFEISALLIATAISQETNKFFYNFRHQDIKIIRIKYNLIASITMFVLLVIAALIESNL